MSIYLKPKILYIGSPNEKSSLILLRCCLRFEFRLIDKKHRFCLFRHVYVCKKSYKLVLRFFKYIYQDQLTFCWVAWSCLGKKDHWKENPSWVFIRNLKPINPLRTLNRVLLFLSSYWLYFYIAILMTFVKHIQYFHSKTVFA